MCGLAFIVFYICFDQMQNNLISQSAQMETGSTPNDMLPAMNQVGCILFTPLIHHVIYPLLHKRHIYLKPITRITIGFGFVVASMAYAAIVQSAIYSTGPCYDHPRTCSSVANREPNHVNIWLQAPVFFLIAMGEVWAYVTALEIAYSHAPKNMKSMIQAIFPLMAGIGSASAMGLTPITHDPNLVIFYASLAGAMAITTVVFWLVFRKHDENDAEDNTDKYTEGAQTPYMENSPRDSVNEGIDVGSGVGDIELGLIPALRPSSAFSLKRSDLTSSTLADERLENIFEVHGVPGETDQFATSPNATQHEVVKQTIIAVPKAAHPVQLLPPPPRSPAKKMRGLQKRLPPLPMMPAEPLPAQFL
ncbi:peptide transporter ptr2 [Didymosphaeria variabile]|uniref:Peptide transporter ptr2 n=1 Tax=Didymosphaeria variabile TaxID=1932322 RepID=A0A9W8XQN3_9PLEO|nr:peptide transporter ptr2 [Didymosphaeria variabile]KAJ4356477.1 peptide transporter ptr2 [Didymosphaeria variabile]